MKKIIGLVTLLMFMLGTVVSAGGVVPDGGMAYIVQADDWLSKLADKHYGDVLAYQTIVDATNALAVDDNTYAVIDNPDVIEIGQKLWIPDTIGGDAAPSSGGSMMDTAPSSGGDMMDTAAGSGDMMDTAAGSGDTMDTAAGSGDMMDTAPAHVATDAPPHWSYTADGGPAGWGDLDPSFATCATGKSQSPIDIADATPEDLANITFNYDATDVNILNNGHTVQVNYDAGSSIEVDGTTYDLLQFHFHAPSEHSINGKLADMEMHLVHKSKAGDLAVVGVLINEGADNAAFQPVWDNMPAKEAAAASAGVQVTATDLLPADQATYRYSGSLTTPPCSEGVSWLVMTNPIEISADQLAAFEAIFTGTNRPVQPLNGRTVVEDSSAK